VNNIDWFVLEVMLKDHSRPRNLKGSEFLKTARSVVNGRF